MRELLGSDGTDPAIRPAAKFVMDREVATDVLLPDMGRLLLGIDLQCAQCHDHPSVTDYQHEHYYGLQAFVAGTKLFKQADGQSVLQENVVREVSFASVFEPSKSEKPGPRLPGGEMVAIPEFKTGDEYVEKPSAKVRAVPKFSLRHALAESLPRAETAAFARNFANRLWAHVMGIGLVQPLDMHHGENLPSHPGLLAALADQLVAMKFDQRQFLRELLLSETYQRSSIAPEGVAADDLPPTSYSIANLKGIGPEQLFDCLVRATANEDNLHQQIDETLAAKPAHRKTRTLQFEQCEKHECMAVSAFVTGNVLKVVGSSASETIEVRTSGTSAVTVSGTGMEATTTCTKFNEQLPTGNCPAGSSRSPKPQSKRFAAFLLSGLIPPALFDHQCCA